MASHPKLRVLCLHGFRTSAAIFEKQILRWSPSILELLDLGLNVRAVYLQAESIATLAIDRLGKSGSCWLQTFLDGPYTARGKSEVEGIFPGPYFEWYQFNKDFSELTNLEECKDYITNYMREHGPFDGLMGFSQGGVLAAAFAGLQQKGLALQQHPPLRFIILVSGAGFNNQQLMHECYSEPVKCPSVHIIGALDFLKKVNEELVLKFENPLVIRHEGKHTVPRLGEEPTELVRDFLLQVLSTPPEAGGKVEITICEGEDKDSLLQLLGELPNETQCVRA